MKNELEVLAKANHPNIMHVFEILHDKKFYFIVSEFIRYGELFNYIVERTIMSNQNPDEVKGPFNELEAA